MIRARIALIACACAGAFSGARGQAITPPSIVRFSLPPEAQERQPVAVPTEPENTVEIDFPWPLADWAGRGFTPDTERFAGDFVIEATRGSPRIFVTPVASGAHRVLHVVLSPPGRAARSVPVEFIPAPEGLAWRKVVFDDGDAVPARGPAVSLGSRPPRSRLREPAVESQIGLTTTLRLMRNAGDAGAAAVAAANPSLQFALLAGGPRSFGDFTITTRFAVRDTATGSLGICADLANATGRRLLFDPQSWVVRAGEHVYPVRTADFPIELEPGAAGSAFLVLTLGTDGRSTGLLPDNDFELSLRESASANPRPVLGLPIEGLDPR